MRTSTSSTELPELEGPTAVSSLPELLEIGAIVRPHGLRGELKFRPHFEGSRALFEVEEVQLRSPSGQLRTVPIEAVRGTAKEPILSLVGVQDRDQAEALRGYAVLVPRTQMPALEPGEYYLVDVVGCEVFLGEARVGVVSEVRPDPSVDTLVIERPDGTRVEQPLLDTWVARVDTSARRVELSSDDGLID